NISTFPALTHLSLKSATPGTFVTADAKNFPATNATVEFKRADGKGTVQNFGLAVTSTFYSPGHGWCFNVPNTLHEGLFKIDLYDKERKVRTNVVSFTVEQPALEIIVDFINFKCIHETGDRGDSDESYFFNFVMEGYAGNFKGGGTKVFHDTDAGHTYGSPY